LLRIGEQW